MSGTSSILIAMIIIRLLSALIELSAASLMYYFNRVEIAVRINAILGIVGPIILIIVTFLGLIDLSQQLNFKKMLLIFFGVIFIILGTY